MTLQAAIDAFLEHQDLARSTRRVYRASLASLVADLGPTTAVRELSRPALAGWFRDRHGAASPATWNRELATLRAAVRWWRHCGWLAVDPTDGLERRRERVDRTRALTRSQLERLFAPRELPHSALTHAAEDGINLPLLLTRSRHASVRSLERYARPGPEAIARHSQRPTRPASDHNRWRPCRSAGRVGARADVDEVRGELPADQPTLTGPPQGCAARRTRPLGRPPMVRRPREAQDQPRG